MGRDSPASRKRRRSSSSSSSTSSSGSSSSSSNSDRKGSHRRTAGSDRRRSSEKSKRPADSGRKPSSSNHKHSSDSDEPNGRAQSTASFDSMDLEKMTRKKDAITSLREQKSGERSSDRQGNSSQRPATQTNHTKQLSSGRDGPYKRRGSNSPRHKRAEETTSRQRSRSPRHRSPVQRKRSPPRKMSRSPVRKEHENPHKRRSRSPAGFRNNRQEYNRGGRDFQPRFNADRQRAPGFSGNRPRRSHSPGNKRFEERKPRRSSPGKSFRRDSNERGAEKTDGFKGSINDKRWQHDGYEF